MHIQHIEISNFRKLQAVRIDLAEKTTVFVGSNNSGKTSAMVAMRRFLVDRSEFAIHDFTLSHWATINAAARSWEQAAPGAELETFDWAAVLPSLDVWLKVPTEELHYVQRLLPTLDWDGTHIGVRLRFQPKDPQALRHEYLKAKLMAAAVMEAAKPAEPPADAGSPAAMPDPADTPFALWPKSMVEFLSTRLRSTFEVRAYLLDPDKLLSPEAGLARPQELPMGSEPIEGDPFKGLIRIDEISAQRGFGFTARSARSDDDEADSEQHSGKKLSSQLRTYYSRHLDPFDKPELKDVEALQALHVAQAAFGKRLSTCFADALEELQSIGYPGVTDPKLKVTSMMQPVDGLKHGSAVQYEVPTHMADGGCTHHLPEDSNGLGYQNLVSMVFALMGFRDRWMAVGKARNATTEDVLTPPLHLVLIEEPEAHLHAQVQQVFINQAYKVLRKHDDLESSNNLRTQLVVSTHSSHLAHESEFASLRYFRRLPAPAVTNSVPVSSVVNLSEVFGNETQTSRFVRRYLKATHCDLFFADGVVLVEGPAERVLVPHLVRTRKEYEYLTRCYITWLEIGGSHAHRLRSLLEHLGLNTLIITDIDAKTAAGTVAVPKRGAGLLARNETLKTWVPTEGSLDALLDMTADRLVTSDRSGYAVRVAYQQPITATFKAQTAAEALANTFEDALLFENIALFAELEGTGLIRKFAGSLKKSADLEELAAEVANDLTSGGKAEFALDILYSDDIEQLKMPAYIHDGLLWLAQQLKRKEDAIAGKATEVPA